MLLASYCLPPDITHCTARKKYGQLMPCHASPFLTGPPSERVDPVALRKDTPVGKAAAKDLFAQMRAAVG